MKEMILLLLVGAALFCGDNPAVLVKEIYSWQRSGASFDDVVDRHRPPCVPPGYVPSPWTLGMW